jgi:hypothetical protein
MFGPGELHGTGRHDSCGHPLFQACLHSLHVEYDPELVHHVLGDVTGASFNRWIHVPLLNCYAQNTRR